jgi:opacity protein-like surface antigen
MINSALSVIMVLLMSASALAREKRPIQFCLATGVAFPTSDFNLKYNHGFNGMVAVDAKVANKFRVVPKVEIQTFAIDQNIFEDSVNGGNYMAFMSGVDLRFSKDIHGWALDPILLVGGGIAYSSVSTLTIGSVVYDSENEVKFYLNVGGGVGILLSPKITGFVTGRYVRISTSDTKTEFFPIDVGIRF